MALLALVDYDGMRTDSRASLPNSEKSVCEQMISDCKASSTWGDTHASAMTIGMRA